MQIRQQLNMRLSQNLVMTQSLQQAIKLLQLSKVELEQLIQEELVQNPVLEEVTVESEPSESELEEAKRESQTTEVDADQNSSSLAEIDQDYFFQEYIEYQHRRSMREDKELPQFDSTLATPTNLIDHLEWQLNLTTMEEKEREIADAILGNINDKGFLRASIPEIAELAGVADELILPVLSMIQHFDPIGVAASDLRECLLIQLEYLEYHDTLSYQIINDHIGLLEKRQYEELAKIYECKIGKIQDALELIRQLDPEPGSKFNSTGNTYVEPDVFIVQVEDDYEVILNEDDLPQLRINSKYQKMLARNSGIKSETRSYLREHMNGAKWLLKSFVQRQRTIFKVVESIVKRQKNFFDHGLDMLKPMILSDIADDIEMHESTVSRVVTNKYVHTPRGIFELKYFFSSGIRSDTGGDVSSLSVKRKIKTIIKGEDSNKPLSDNRVMAILNSEGLKIARRTVAKYREELKIPPSKLRKSAF